MVKNLSLHLALPKSELVLPFLGAASLSQTAT